VGLDIRSRKSSGGLLIRPPGSDRVVLAHEHGGTVVKLLRDGAILHFPDPEEGVLCGLELVEKVEKAGLPLAGGHRSGPGRVPWRRLLRPSNERGQPSNGLCQAQRDPRGRDRLAHRARPVRGPPLCPSQSHRHPSQAIDGVARLVNSSRRSSGDPKSCSRVFPSPSFEA
jgi:hypothetical protein